ncbi:MAG TPA: beta-galactosidase [Phycisphaerae bacterium]|nr:beta-galactosidase [Phycisphaerae bacterium]
MIRSAGADDQIFPPPNPATSVIDINGQGFTINGKPVFITCGSMDYERVPPQLWADRLMRMKQAGFNTIATYIYWSFQEPHQGQFDFTGQHDLAAYLALAKQMGLYVFLRVGPYDNGEWDSGGLPVWLRFIPGLSVRDSDKPFMDALDKYFNQLLPIVAANQISKGGPVILLQLENEYFLGMNGYLHKEGGTDIPNPYFQYLHDKPVQMGINLPSFFNGIHQGYSPAGFSPEPDGGPAPWFTSEMWTGWFNQYGPNDPPAERHAQQSVWRVIAYGGGGYNLFLAVGGTNFAHWNCDTVQSSYDFGAPIGQAGDLRSMYYNYKLANYFADSFQQLLATSRITGSNLSGLPSNIFATARSSPNGTITFLENRSFQDIPWQATPDCRITLDEGEIFPVVQNFPINDSFTLNESYVRIFGILNQGNTTTLVIYGDPGQQGQVQIGIAPDAELAAKSDDFIADSTGKEFTLNITFPQSGPESYLLQTQKTGQTTGSNQVLRVLVESTSEAKRTWFMPIQGQPSIVCGPDYVSQSASDNGMITLQTERPIDAENSQPTLAYGAYNPQQNSDIPMHFSPVAGAQDPSSADLTPPQLGPWRVLRADGPASPDYDDSKWLSTAQPLAMGADDYDGAYEWYRTTVNVSRAGDYVFQAPNVQDSGILFVNGVKVDTDDLSRPTVTLQQGKNTIAILTISDGRNKLYRFTGLFNNVDAKGLLPPVSLLTTQGATVQVNGLKLRQFNGSQDQLIAQILADQPGDGWTPLDQQTSPTTAQNGYEWLHATLPHFPPGRMQISIANPPPGTIAFFNSRQILLHSVGQNLVARIEFSAASNADNYLDIVVPNPVAIDKNFGPISIASTTLAPALPGNGSITHWRMHGGLDVSPDATTGWTDYTQEVDVPCYYATTFTWQKNADGVDPVFRLAWGNLSGGYVWLNGHNLGRYPDSVMQMGIYLPSCWINEGANSLVVLDETGQSLDGVHLVTERVASRQEIVLQAQPNASGGSMPN